jgi:hypothetical protein
MAKDPKARVASMGVFAEALGECLAPDRKGGEPVRPMQSSPGEARGLHPHKWRSWAGSACLVLVAVVLGLPGWLAWLRTGPEHKSAATGGDKGSVKIAQLRLEVVTPFARGKRVAPMPDDPGAPLEAEDPIAPPKQKQDAKKAEGARGGALDEGEEIPEKKDLEKKDPEKKPPCLPPDDVKGREFEELPRKEQGSKKSDNASVVFLPAFAPDDPDDLMFEKLPKKDADEKVDPEAKVQAKEHVMPEEREDFFRPGNRWKGTLHWQEGDEAPVQVQVVIYRRSGDCFWGVYSADDGTDEWRIEGRVNGDMVEWKFTTILQEEKPRNVVGAAVVKGRLDGKRLTAVMTMPVR